MGHPGFCGWLKIGRCLDFELACAGRPLRLDFYGVGFAGGVVVEAAPTVVFRLSDQAAGDGVAVDVLALFDELFWVDTLKS